MRILGLSLVAALAACSSSKPSHAVEASEAAKLLIDRNWIDRMPENHTDKLHVYRFVPTMGGGVYQDRTLFKGTFELFKFEATGDRVRIVLPETRTKVLTAYQIEAVDGPKPFDLKLTIAEDPRGGGVYYGIRAETDRAGEALEARLAALPDAP